MTIRSERPPPCRWRAGRRLRSNLWFLSRRGSLGAHTPKCRNRSSIRDGRLAPARWRATPPDAGTASPCVGSGIARQRGGPSQGGRHGIEETPSLAQRRGARREAGRRAQADGAGHRAAALQRGLAALAPRPPPLPLLQLPQPAPDRFPATRAQRGSPASAAGSASATPSARASAASASGLPARRRSASCASGGKPARTRTSGRGPSSAWSRSSIAPRSIRCPSSPAARSFSIRRSRRSRARA